MESRFQHLLVVLATLAALGGTDALAATDADELELEPLVVREPERRTVDVDQIDSENFELGAYGGMLSVEDFGTSPVYGVRATYHLTEDFFVEAAYALSELGETSFERLSGGAQILTDEQREFSYYNISVGYNVFPGEAYVGRNWAFRGGLYFIGGVGASDFADDQRFTINAGVGYRFILNDFIAFHTSVKDHMFETDLLGESRVYHNLEFTAALTVFF